MGNLTRFLTNHNNDISSLRKKFRSKRLLPFMEMIETVHSNKGSVSILDVGGKANYWKILGDDYLEKFNVKITLLNLPTGKVLKDTALIKHIDFDATNQIWNFYNQSDFDLIHSNSVIEHVGDWEMMKKFASNITSFKGGYFVQVPNFWFPVEPHCMTFFFHWLPKPIRLFLVQKMKLGHWPKANNISEAVEIVDSARLLNKLQFAFLFNDAEIISEKLFLLTKSFVAIRRVVE